MGEFGDGLELEKQRTPLNFLQESWIFGCAKPSTLGEFLKVLEMVFLQKKVTGTSLIFQGKKPCRVDRVMCLV